MNLKRQLIAFFALRKIRQISAVVWLIHLFLILFLSLHHFICFRELAAKKLTIRISQQPHPYQLKTTPPPAFAKPKIAQKKTALKPTQQKLVSKEKKSLPAEKKRDSQKATETLKKRAPREWNIPAPLIESSSLSPTPFQEDAIQSYSARLIAFLQKNLQLQGWGSVAIKLVLRAPGQFESLEILEAQNEKNSSWIKNQLIHLEYPCFNELGIENTSLEFKITFRNAESHF